MSFGSNTVVIIIGILAAIAIPVFLSQRDSARVAAVESDLRNIGSAATSCAAAKDGNYSSCDFVELRDNFDFNPSDQVDWGVDGANATITASANSWEVTGVEHADNSSIVGSFSTDDGQVDVTGP